MTARTLAQRKARWARAGGKQHEEIEEYEMVQSASGYVLIVAADPPDGRPAMRGMGTRPGCRR